MSAYAVLKVSKNCNLLTNPPSPFVDVIYGWYLKQQTQWQNRWLWIRPGQLDIPPEIKISFFQMLVSENLPDRQTVNYKFWLINFWNVSKLIKLMHKVFLHKFIINKLVFSGLIFGCFPNTLLRLGPSLYYVSILFYFFWTTYPVPTHSLC